MIRGIFTIAFCLSVGVLLGQTTGDYRSAVTTGTWSTPGTWETYDGATWIPAVAAPSGVATANDINILSGHTITVTSSVTADQLTVDAGGILVISGAAVTLSISESTGSAQDLLVNGTLTITNGVLNASSATSVIRVASGGIINCNGQVTNTTSSNLLFDATSVFVLQNVQGSVPMANWDLTSTCRITANYTGSNLGLAGQTFGNFEWNTPTLTSQQDLNGSLTNVLGTLNFVNTGGSLVYLNQSTPNYTLNIGGSMILGTSARVGIAGSAGSTVNVTGAFTSRAVLLRGSNGTGSATINVTSTTTMAAGTLDAGSSTGSTIFNLQGSYTNSGAAITKSGSPATGMTINFSGALQTFTSTNVPTFPVNFTTSGTGLLYISATSFLAGPGNLTVGAGTSLVLLNVQKTGALVNGTASGAVRVSGVRTYNGKIVFAATGRQYMSPDHPGTASTRIFNASGVEMLGSVTFTTGTLDLNKGLLRIANGSTLTVATVLHNGGFMGITSTSSIVINGSGSYGNLALTRISGTTNTLKNLTINRTSGTVNQATSDLIIAGTLTLTSGALVLGNNTTTINGPFAVTSGTMTGISTSKLIIGGSGSLTGTLSMTGSLNTLTMNRGGGSLNFSNSSPNFLDVLNLNLFNGDVNNSGGLRMATSGLITRANGSLLSAIGAVSTYSVTYTTFSTADLSIGFEIPSSGTALNNFTINNTLAGTHNVHLNRAIDAAGSVTITRGALVTDNNNINVGVNFSIPSTGSLVPGSSTITFDGSGTQIFGGAVLYTINDIVINKTGGTFNLNSGVVIRNSFAINSATRANVGTDRLILLSTSSATAYVPQLFVGSSIVGSVVVQRHLPNTNSTRAYRYISSPTTSSTVADWKNEFPVTGTFSDPSTGVYNGVQLISTNPSLFYYNEALVTGSSTQSAGYVNYPASGTAAAAPLVNGRGYAAFVRTTGEITFDSRGTLKQQDLNLTVTHSGGTNGGYNLIGNPYPAPVDWDATLAASSGVNSAIYFTDNTRNISTSGNVVYSGGVSVPAGYSGDIASSQAFWVKVTNPGTGTVRFRENQKAPAQTKFIREGDIPNLLRITMKTGTVTDHVAVRLVNDATEDFDDKYDGYKFGFDGMLNISTLSKNNERLAINAIGTLTCDTKIPFYIDGAKTGNYTLDFTGMESFQGDINLILFDKILNTRTPISTTSHYTFSVSDVSLAKDRFELLLEGPPVDTELLVSGENICEGNSVAYLTLQSSQPSVKYSAVINGETISSEVEGTGTSLQIPIPVEALPQDINEIAVAARMFTCESRLLTQKASVSIVKKSEINSVSDGTTCANDKATLSAVGLGANSYNWYESLDGLEPIAEQHGDKLITPVLSKSKTYYVAAVNSLGCEGTRVEVKANVINVEPATISVEGNVLTSNYAEGNQWYLDGVPIDGATSSSFDAVIPGIYSVSVSAATCTTVSAGREMLILATEESNSNFINIYPNPTVDKITMEIRSSSNNIEARVINTSGMEIITQKLSGTSDVKTGEFNLSSYPSGIYLIRVKNGGKLYTKKVSKK